MDCLLNQESDEASSIGIQNYIEELQGSVDMDIHSERGLTSDESSWENYEGGTGVPLTAIQAHSRNVAIRDTQHSSVGSRTDGKNSDIGDLADFSSDEEEAQVEQISGCLIPGCRCDEDSGNMEWKYDDLSDSEDSEWEDPGQRSIRLEVEHYNLDLFEGMTPMTFTPPPRKNRRKWYEDDAQYTPEMLEEIRRINEMGFQTDEDLPQWETELQQTTVADENIPLCRDKKDNYEAKKRAVRDTDSPSIILADSNYGEFSECFDRPVTQLVTVRDTDAEEALVMNVLTVATEQSELRDMEVHVCETDTRVMPVSWEELTIERLRPASILPGAIQQVKMRNKRWDCVDYCFGVCKTTDRVNQPETCSCWNCCCLIIWIYHVSCWAAIVVKGRFYGIDLYVKDRGIFTSGLVLVGNPMTPYDVIRVYTEMNENFKGGMNNVVIMNNDPVDRRYSTKSRLSS